MSDLIDFQNAIACKGYTSVLSKMVSVIFAVLEVSFWALTTVVKLPWKFLILITTKSQPFLEGHLLPVPAKFGRGPFPRSSVILFTDDRTNERMTENDHITSALLTEVLIITRAQLVLRWPTGTWRGTFCKTPLKPLSVGGIRTSV